MHKDLAKVKTHAHVITFIYVSRNGDDKIWKNSTWGLTQHYPITRQSNSTFNQKFNKKAEEAETDMSRADLSGMSIAIL